MTNQTLATPVVLGPALIEQQAREIYRQGEEAVVFALLTLAQRAVDPEASTPPVVTPTTPSAMIPPSLKPKATAVHDWVAHNPGWRNQPRISCAETSRNPSPMASYRCSLARAPTRRRNPLNFENISSIGV
jgi:hypothetical protein